MILENVCRDLTIPNGIRQRIRIEFSRYKQAIDTYNIMNENFSLVKTKYEHSCWTYFLTLIEAKDLLSFKSSEKIMNLSEYGLFHLPSENELIETGQKLIHNSLQVECKKHKLYDPTLVKKLKIKHRSFKYVSTDYNRFINKRNKLIQKLQNTVVILRRAINEIE